ncbi:MAG: hypothetical protein RSB71_02765 [Bacilli bacterium]
MKYLIILILLLTGCHNNYDNYVEETKGVKVSLQLPCDINFYIDEVNENRLIYQVIIDNPQYELKDVKAMVVHNVKTNDVFPSIGIVDNVITLNKDNKGIILIGHVDKKDKIEFKVLLEINNQKYGYIYNY